jgi:hypothetical protein
MALDIIISDSHGNPEMSIPLYFSDYDFIMGRIGNEKDFSLLNKVLADYYGTSEIYLNELSTLENEIFQLEEKLGVVCPQGIAAFVESFLSLIEYAKKNNRTIQFVGD